MLSERNTHNILPQLVNDPQHTGKYKEINLNDRTNKNVLFSIRFVDAKKLILFNNFLLLRIKFVTDNVLN